MVLMTDYKGYWNTALELRKEIDHPGYIAVPVYDFEKGQRSVVVCKVCQGTWQGTSNRTLAPMFHTVVPCGLDQARLDLAVALYNLYSVSIRSD